MKPLFSRKPMRLADSELIEKYRYSHDTAYVAELFQRHTHLLATLCMKYLKHPEDCEDAIMEVFEILVRDLKRHHIDNFKAWLFSVTKNHCLKKLRAQRQLPATELLDENAAADVEFQAEPALSKQRVEQQLDHLEQSIERLPEEQQQCIRMFYFQKLSYKEVAEQSGFTLKQVKSYLQNGKRNLKLSLTNRHG